MNIEWWMVDGFVGLIILISAITGAARGIGDSILRIAGFVAGVVLSVMYSGNVGMWLWSTRLSGSIHDHIFTILRNKVVEDTGAAAGSGTADINTLLGNGVTGGPADPVTEAMPKTLVGIANEVADKTAEAAADRLTQVAISIMAFVVVMIGVWLLTCIICMIYRKLRKNSLILGFVDRTAGFVLGVIKGILISCIAGAVAVPVMTWIEPLKVPELIDALHASYVAGIIYDTNPVLLVIRHFLL